jgi:hypothetical protein
MITNSDRRRMRSIRPAWEETFRSETLNALRSVGKALRGLDSDALDECIQHGLIPRHLVDCLEMTRFVAPLVISAHKAQAAYGVPAGLLIALAADEFSWDARRVDEHWFMDRAKRLAADPRLALVLSGNDPDWFIKALRECAAFDEDKRGILVQLINDFSLQECDALGRNPAAGMWRSAVRKAAVSK